GLRSVPPHGGVTRGRGDPVGGRENHPREVRPTRLPQFPTPMKRREDYQREDYDPDGYRQAKDDAIIRYGEVEDLLNQGNVEAAKRAAILIQCNHLQEMAFFLIGISFPLS